MKKIATFLAFSVILSIFGANQISLHAERSSEKTEHSLEAASLEAPLLVVDGKAIYSEAPPQASHNDIETVWVPVRPVSEALGYGVFWNSLDGSVIVFDKETEIILASMRVNSTRAALALGIHGVMDERIFDRPAYLVNDRLMVPAAFISEALACRDRWDPDLGVLTITPLHSS